MHSQIEIQDIVSRMKNAGININMEDLADLSLSISFLFGRRSQTPVNFPRLICIKSKSSTDSSVSVDVFLFSFLFCLFF